MPYVRCATDHINAWGTLTKVNNLVVYPWPWRSSSIFFVIGLLSRFCIPYKSSTPTVLCIKSTWGSGHGGGRGKLDGRDSAETETQRLLTAIGGSPSQKLTSNWRYTKFYCWDDNGCGSYLYQDGLDILSVIVTTNLRWYHSMQVSLSSRYHISYDTM